MTITTVGGGIKSIVRDCKLLWTTANGATPQIKEDQISLAPHGSKEPQELSFHSEWAEVERMIINVARLLRVRMEALQWPSRFNNPKDQGHPLRRATRFVILAEEMSDPKELAFLYGITERSVRRIRSEAGRDPETGERRGVDTEPARDTLRRLESE